MSRQRHTTDDALKALQVIPGIGPRMARALVDLGYRKVADLHHQDPQQMYRALTALRGQHIDRCVLYVFRCAVYFASHRVHEPERLKWWYWKDSD